jgi:two-component system response regulator MprA
MDDTAKIVTVESAKVDLPPREYELLKVFLSHPRQILSRDSILTMVWGANFAGGDSVVDVYVGYLRKKLDPEHRYIQTVRGMGYRFTV